MKIALPTGYRPHQSLIKQTTFTAVMVKCSLDSETVFTVCQRKGRKIKQNNGTVQKKKKEKEMAAHSSILAWRIAWTEEPSGLQSMRLQKLDLTQ